MRNETLYTADITVSADAELNRAVRDQQQESAQARSANRTVCRHE